MKKQLSILALLMLFLSSCYTAGKCPTTNKKYFYKGIKGSKPLYKGYKGSGFNRTYTK